VFVRVCVRARVCMWGLCIVCDVAYYNVRERTVRLIPEQVTCFGMSKLLVLIFSLFAYYYSIPSSSFALRAPFYDTLPHTPHSHGHGKCLSAVTFHPDDNPLFR